LTDRLKRKLEKLVIAALWCAVSHGVLQTAFGAFKNFAQPSGLVNLKKTANFNAAVARL
jgi:hypothetical protein